MHIRPRFSGPIKKPLAPSKFITQVDEPLMPILSSIEPQLTLLRSAKEPSSAMLYLGTINKEIPLVPSGAFGRRANTICTIWSVKSRSEEHTSELQSRPHLVCRLLLEKKKKKKKQMIRVVFKLWYKWLCVCCWTRGAVHW